MDPLTIGSLAGGVLGGLFGKSKRNPYQTQIGQQVGYLSGVRNQYSENATTAQANANNYGKKQFSALDDYADLLQRDPNTDSYRTRAIARSTAGTNAAYTQAKANLQADMIHRGVSGGSGDIGGLEAIEAARAGTFANAENAQAAQEVADRNQRASDLVGLYSGVTNQERAAANTALGNEANISQFLLDSYVGQNNTGNQLAANDDAAMTQGLSNLGGLIGTAVGGRQKVDPKMTFLMSLLGKG